MWDNLPALDAFAKFVRVTNHTGLWDVKLAWYSLNLPLWLWLLSCYQLCLHLLEKLIVTANWLKSQNGTLFSHVWRRGRLALNPLWNKSSFRVLISGITELIYYVRDEFRTRLTAAGKGFQISHYHTPTRPLSSFPKTMEEYGPIGFSRNNIIL